MQKFNYLIRRQFEQRGYMAGLSFFIEETDNKSEIICHDENSLKYFKEIVENAFNQFQNIYSENFKMNLKLTVYEIYWFPVDTTLELMRYIVIRSLSDFLNVDFLPFINENDALQFHFLHHLTFKKINENVFYLG